MLDIVDTPAVEMGEYISTLLSNFIPWSDSLTIHQVCWS